MNLTHLHLLVNHFPTVGFAIGLGLFVGSLFIKSEDLKRASLAVLFLIALVSIPAYLSGNGAQRAIKDNPDVSALLITAHESAALVALVFMQAAGFSAWLGLWQYRRTKRVPVSSVVAVLLLSIATFGLMAKAANRGGQIRHPEIVSPGSAATAR